MSLQQMTLHKRLKRKNEDGIEGGEIENNQSVNEAAKLMSLLHRYARENLLLANIYIKDPAVEVVKKDQKIPVIWFVANVGGILGLCMGCSLVTIFEVLHHVTLILLRTSAKGVSKISKVVASSPFAITTAIAQGALNGPPNEIENIGSTPGPDKNVSEGINKQNMSVNEE